MLICSFVFDWNSFWINIIAGFIFFIASLIVSIWLIPKFTVRLIKRKNKSFSIIKISAVIEELCEFLSDSPYRDPILNSERILIYTKNKDLKVKWPVALCVINVFSKIVYPKMLLVIYDFYNSKNPIDSYKLISEEYNRLKSFRLEIERIIAVHSLHLDDKIIQKISILCFDIKKLETKHKLNILYDELLESTNNERDGIFGLDELPKIYERILLLVKELVCLDYFQYEISKKD